MPVLTLVHNLDMNIINERLAVIDYLEKSKLSLSCPKLFYFDKNMALSKKCDNS